MIDITDMTDDEFDALFDAVEAFVPRDFSLADTQPDPWADDYAAIVDGEL